MQYRNESYAEGVFDTFWFEKNLQGDVVAIYNNSGVKLASYIYDAWGNFTVTYSNGGATTAAQYNPFTYRSYYYDDDLGLYYLNSRYYDSNTGRFINADVQMNSRLLGYNLYAYCENNPVVFIDRSGYVIDTILDIFFIGWDIYDLIKNDGYKKWENWATLGSDVLFAFVPFLSGGGQVVKLANVADNISDFKKVTVIGETMQRVQNVSQFVNATDNLYDGFKYYEKLSKIRKGGKVLAEIGGKMSNIAWLYGKVRKGYTVIDIGIDIGRATRSSSYIVERTFLIVWQNRNLWKFSYHIFWGE